jgi:hypothetical protein
LLERSHYEIEELKLNFQEQSSSLHLHRDVWTINLKFDNRRTHTFNNAFKLKNQKF